MQVPGITIVQTHGYDVESVAYWYISKVLVTLHSYPLSRQVIFFNIAI